MTASKRTLYDQTVGPTSSFDVLMADDPGYNSLDIFMNKTNDATIEKLISTLVPVGSITIFKQLDFKNRLLRSHQRGK